MPEMIAVTKATWFREDQHTLVNLSCRAGLVGQARLREHVVALCTLCLCHHKFGGECFLHVLGVGCYQLVFWHQPSLRPQRGIICRAEALNLAEQFYS